MTSFSLWQRFRENKYTYKQKLNKNVAVIKSLPKYLVIPSLELKLPVYTSEIKSGKWETTAEGVSYLLSSGLPGQYSNTVIYGHNWNSLLG
jgi:sortase (surface protein transpeptidase)